MISFMDHLQFFGKDLSNIYNFDFGNCIYKTSEYKVKENYIKRNSLLSSGLTKIVCTDKLSLKSTTGKTEMYKQRAENNKIDNRDSINLRCSNFYRKRSISILSDFENLSLNNESCEINLVKNEDLFNLIRNNKALYGCNK